MFKITFDFNDMIQEDDKEFLTDLIEGEIATSFYQLVEEVDKKYNAFPFDGNSLDRIVVLVGEWE